MTARSHGSERLRDAVTGVALLGFSVTLWFYLIPVHASGHGQHTVLAETAAIIIGFLAAVLLVLSALGIPTEATNASETDPFLEVSAGREPPRLFIFAAVWGGYVLALPYIGFYGGGVIALLVSYLLLGMRSITMLCLWTGGTILATFLVFDLGFKLALPHGKIFADLGG